MMVDRSHSAETTPALRQFASIGRRSARVLPSKLRKLAASTLENLRSAGHRGVGAERTRHREKLQSMGGGPRAVQ
jgi:hypothetical protein